MGPSPRRIFLPWDRPLLTQAVEFLAAEWRGGAPLDLSPVLVVVPTAQSGRRLREALAAHAARKNQAAFAPRVVTPEALVALNLGPDVAGRADALLAWAEVFRAIPLDAFRAVFPIDPPARNFDWALRLAQQFLTLQVALTEAGLRFADVPVKAGPDFPEAERWRQLAALEQRHAEQLAISGWRGPQAARIAFAREPELPPGITRIVLLATPDPMPLALGVLASHAAKVPVDVVVFAPASEAAGFDSWGRPDARAWAGRELALPAFDERVHLCADPAAQATRLVAAAKEYAAPDGAIALGVADPEILPLLEGGLARAGIAAFNPEGRSQRVTTLFHLLRALADLAGEADWRAVAALARCPDFLAWLGGRLGGGFSAARWLKDLDDLRVRHLPMDLEAALAHAGGQAQGLGLMAELRAQLRKGNFPANAEGALAEIFAARQLDLEREDDARFEALASAWTEVLRQCAAARERYPALRNAEWWEFALQLFGEKKESDDKPAAALELQGWLELLFEDAPHLAVAGVNDGFVPDAVAGDAFLPESLRGRLGLKTNAARFARDAYLLQAIASCRPRLDVLFGKVSLIGEPLRPSRLLLRCADPALPARVGFLFREPAAPRPGLAWTRAWQLTPPRVPAPAQVSVTALRKWLDCPFRFYLRHVLRLQPIDPMKDELDALDFGTLVHRAMEELGGEEPLRACRDAATLREFLHGRLERDARERFGRDLSLGLLIQLESARQRLGKAAEIEAEQRAAGWRTLVVERKFTLEVGGLTVVAKIDRIDRHETTGAVRVLDYKTSDRAAVPADTHLRKPRPGESPRPWAAAEIGGKPRVWSDLQLPLYERALAAEFGPAVACGYFNLPKVIGETGIEMWEALTPELRASAWRCAEGVCAAIRAGEFWPARELHGREAEWDEFAPLFHHGAAASIAWAEGGGR